MCSKMNTSLSLTFTRNNIQNVNITTLVSTKEDTMLNGTKIS